MKTKIRSLFVLMIAVLLLTACRIVVDTEVKSDGSGELRSAVVFTAQEKENFSQKPENQSKSICADLGKDVPDDARFVEEIRDGETFCTTERSFSSLAELRTLYAGMSQVTVNTLQFELGKFTLDVDVDLTNNKEGEGLVNEWRLTLPGEIGKHNANRVEGQTLVWVVEPGTKDHLYAESQVGASPSTVGASGGLALIAIGGILVLALAGIVLAFLLIRRNRQR